jgi:2-oxoglutarate ferredoxin oxidoreductase subunit gamma
MTTSQKINSGQKRSKNNCEDMLFAGFGGQGIMFMGKLLVQAGLAAGKHVTWMPSYGIEVRGGTAYSMAKISNIEIANPIVDQPDFLVVMNKPSLVRYESKLKPDGILISNKSLIDISSARKDVKIVNIPMTDLAAKLGNPRCANMIAVGALVKRSRMLSLRDVTASLKTMLQGKEDLFILNKKALEKGYKL